nr:hypothetical protein [Glycocaulis alkaliphilus]
MIAGHDELGHIELVQPVACGLKLGALAALGEVAANHQGGWRTVRNNPCSSMHGAGVLGAEVKVGQLK